MKARSLSNGPFPNVIRLLVTFVLLAFAFGVNAQSSCQYLYAKSGGVPGTSKCRLADLH